MRYQTNETCANAVLLLILTSITGMVPRRLSKSATILQSYSSFQSIFTIMTKSAIDSHRHMHISFIQGRVNKMKFLTISSMFRLPHSGENSLFCRKRHHLLSFRRILTIQGKKSSRKLPLPPILLDPSAGTKGTPLRVRRRVTLIASRHLGHPRKVLHQQRHHHPDMWLRGATHIAELFKTDYFLLCVPLIPI